MITNFKIKEKKILLKIFITFSLGFLSSFSLPPYNFIFLNFIVYPVFFLLLCNNAKRRSLSFLFGWAFGFGYFFSNIYWITNSLTFDDSFTKLIPLTLFIIPLFLGLFYGVSTLVINFFTIKNNISSILFFAATISLFEYLRGTILTGFPWNLIVFSLSDYLSSLQILSLVGTYSLNLFAITVFLMPIIIFSKKKFIYKFILVSLTVTIILLNIVYGSNRIKNYEKNSFQVVNTSIKIISPKIQLTNFFEQSDPSNRIKELVQLSNPSLEESFLYIFPEGILSGVFLEELKEFQFLFKDKFNLNDKIILGINSQENSKIFNSMVLLDHDLKIIKKYKKNKLVPFGEFLPFENILSKFNLKKITQGYNSFSDSNQREQINLDGLTILPLICYEIIYTGRLNINQKKFNLIINISEDGWFGNSIGPYQHFSHSIFRSIEEGKNILRSSNNGISAHVNPIGQVIGKVESTKSGVIYINELKQIEKTHFSKFGNKIFFYFIAIYITLIFFLKKRG